LHQPQDFIHLNRLWELPAQKKAALLLAAFSLLFKAVI
jgi:hypothetical protein